MSQFGSIFLSDQFDASAIAIIQTWIDEYLDEVERRSGLDIHTIDRPRSYNVVIDPEKFPEDALPTIMVVSAGVDGQLERVGHGQYNGWWTWTVVCFVSFRDEAATRKAAQLYGAALRALVVQKAGPEGLGDTTYVNESMAFADLTERSRNLGIVALEFSTYIDGMVEEYEGPLATVADSNAHPQESADWPQVQTTDVTLNPERIDA